MSSKAFPFLCLLFAIISLMISPEVAAAKNLVSTSIKTDKVTAEPSGVEEAKYGWGGYGGDYPGRGNYGGYPGRGNDGDYYGGYPGRGNDGDYYGGYPGRGNYGGYPGRGNDGDYYGGYPGRGNYGGYGGDYSGDACLWGCCGYRRRCNRCCKYAGEVADAKP